MSRNQAKQVLIPGKTDKRQAARKRCDGGVRKRQSVSVLLPSHYALTRITSKNDIVMQIVDIHF